MFKGIFKSKSKSKRTPIKYSKIIVSLVIILNTLITVATLLVFLETGKEPTALIAAWFSFTTGEMWLLSGIKKDDNKNIKKKTETMKEIENG